MSDIVKDLTEYRIRGIEKAEIEFYESLTRTLDRIEDQIVSLVDRDLPRQAGKLIELQSAVAIRPKIKVIPIEINLKPKIMIDPSSQIDVIGIT